MIPAQNLVNRDAGRESGALRDGEAAPVAAGRTGMRVRLTRNGRNRNDRGLSRAAARVDRGDRRPWQRRRERFIGAGML